MAPFKHAPIHHHGELIERTWNGTPIWKLAAGGPKQVVAHPLGAYIGYDNRRASDEATTDVELGRGAYAKGQRVWADDAVERFFDTYTDKRVVTEDAFHQALTWLVLP